MLYFLYKFLIFQAFVFMDLIEIEGMTCVSTRADYFLPNSKNELKRAEFGIYNSFVPFKFDLCLRVEQLLNTSVI